MHRADMFAIIRNLARADKQLDVAATVLRMLYIKDLRLLQSQVDESIVAIQVMLLLL